MTDKDDIKTVNTEPDELHTCSGRPSTAGGHIYDAVIVGAGASGMVAAIMALRRGKDVLLIDHKGEPGKKILQTGNGKCNMTHEDVSARNYPPEFRFFLTKAFEVFGYKETIDFFRSIGVITKNRDGYIYPYSGTALSVRNALWDEIKGLGGRIMTFTSADEVVPAVQNADDGICRWHEKVVATEPCGGYEVVVSDVKTGETDRIMCKNVVLATGLKAAPKTGSDGSGLKIAESLGLEINPVCPGLVKLLSDDRACRIAAGVRHTAKVGIHYDGELQVFDTGEVQFAKDGISGIPVFQVSREAVYGLSRGDRVDAVLDLLPGVDDAFIEDMLETARVNEMKNRRNLTNFWGGLLPAGLAKAVADKVSISPDRKICEIPEEKLRAFADTSREFRLKITGDNGFDSAQVCTGGVDTSGIDPETMAVIDHKGLYCVGELVDIDGPCGGFNLQWAWTAGAIAGMNI